MNRNHRISFVAALIVLLAASVPAQARRQAAPAGRGRAGASGRAAAASTSGLLEARKLCDIAAKSQFVDPVNHGAPTWQAEEAACYGSRQLTGDAQNVNLIVHGTKASDEGIRSTIQLFFTAAEGVMVPSDTLKAVAVPLLRAFLTAAGEEVPADLIRDIGLGVQGRLGTARVPVESDFGRGYYKLTIYFPGRTIQ